MGLLSISLPKPETCKHYSIIRLIYLHDKSTCAPYDSRGGCKFSPVPLSFSDREGDKRRS